MRGMGLNCSKRIWEKKAPVGRWTWLEVGNSRHGTCWEIANPMTTSSSRTSQVTTAELAFRCLTVTLTGAEGLSARRESRAFTGTGHTARARKGVGKDLLQDLVWICDLEIAGTPGLNSQSGARRCQLRV